MDSVNPKYYSVTQYNKAIKKFLDDKPELSDVHMEGEISNFKGHTRGHLYFTLKDEESRMSAVMFQGNASYLNFEPKDGDKVLVDGKISCYTATGSYQVYVESMVLSGNGDLLQKLEELKAKLSKEGLFDDAHKKAIPKYPKRIGIVTASTGAAIRDILTTIKRRYPLCETILFPSLVQGELAKDDIVRQIKKAQEYDLDTLIVGRGGGSIEDLWAFNEEVVARAIFECDIPVISAVGHEIDFTIADLVADMRAATPTAAAELAVPNIIELASEIKQKQIRLNKTIKNKLDLENQKLDGYINDSTNVIKHKLKNAISMFNQIKQNHILNNPKDIFLKQNNSLELLINKLELLNPLSVLKKGYQVTEKNNKVITSVKELNKDDDISIRFTDGFVKSKVSEVEINE